MNSDETVRMTLPGKAGKSAGRIPITNQFAGIFRKLLFRMSKWKRPFACWHSSETAVRSAICPLSAHG
jgi:hypothetical protein